ncbi:iron ABC transporter, periplasmic iron-binding protein [Campylobacter blaseri]|nr:ABC transporter substrate-binding protein [Campylobacter blaseri]QKF85244.1 iron ABC transporter, periplasmic iron-binding protein [Campylobacter blaseri]
MFRKLVLIVLFSIFACATEVIDILDRKVDIKDNPKRVVLTFYFEEYFTATKDDGIDKIVGWSRKYWEGRRQASWDAFKEKFPQIDEIPDVGYGPKNTISFEKIISLKPDVVVFALNDYAKVKNNLANLEAANIPAVFIDFHDQKLSNHVKSMEILGEIFKTQDKVKKVVEFYKSKFEIVQNRLKNIPNFKKPKVYLEFSEKDGPSVFGGTWDDKMWGAFANIAGGENIAKGIVKGTTATINPELIIAKNPDVIIFAGNYFLNSYKNIPLGYGITKEQAKANLKAYATRPGWNSINAVKNGHIYALYHDLSRHIFDFTGVLFFAKALHPEIFSDIEPEEELKKFFDEFYPVKYSGTWMISY